MAMQYGIINTATFDEYVGPSAPAWPTSAGIKPNDVTLAIAAAMPSVYNGHRSKRGGLRSGGKGAVYLSKAFVWAQGDGFVPLTDAEYYAIPGIVKPGSNPSNKQNHLNDLSRVDPPMIVKHKVGGGYFCALTEAGVAHVKAVDAELGKLAKAYGQAAYEKAAKAAAKAAQPVKAKKAKKATTPIDPMADIPVEGPTAEAETEGLSGEVEAQAILGDSPYVPASDTTPLESFDDEGRPARYEA